MQYKILACNKRPKFKNFESHSGTNTIQKKYETQLLKGFREANFYHSIHQDNNSATYFNYQLNILPTRYHYLVSHTLNLFLASFAMKSKQDRMLKFEVIKKILNKRLPFFVQVSM